MLKKVLNIAIVITIITISLTTVSYSYFKCQVQSEVDLKIKIGSLDVSISEGINTTLQPGQSSDYKEFTITNTGTLDQIAEISFDNIDNNTYDLENILYQLQIKESENTYKTLLDGKISDIYEETVKYRINENQQLILRSNITILENINPEMYDRDLDFKLKIEGHQINEK